GKALFMVQPHLAAIVAPRIDLLICSHISLLPVAYLLKLILQCKLVAVVYGIEAWKPLPHRIANYLCGRLEAFIAIRKVTAKLFRAWAHLDSAKSYYLPNCIDNSRYGVAPRRFDLESKYGTKGKTVIMT